MTLKHPGPLADLPEEKFVEWDTALTAAAEALSTKSDLSEEELALIPQIAEWVTEAQGEHERRHAAAAAVTQLDEQKSLLASFAARDTGGQAAAATDDAPPPENNTDASGGDVDAAGVLSAVERLIDSVADRLPAAPEAPSTPPTVADLVGAGAETGTPPPSTDGPAIMVASANYGAYTQGEDLHTRGDLADALSERIRKYASTSRQSGPVLPRTKPSPARKAQMMESQAGGAMGLTHRSVPISDAHQRHGVAKISRDIHPEQEFGNNAQHNRLIAEDASRDWVQQLGTGRRAAMGGTARDTLVASWCAPSARWLELCEQWSLDGVLPLPERTVSEGSVELAQGYDLAAVLDAIGENTATCEELDAGIEKTCVEATCLDTINPCLNVDWLCITANLLQRRAWKESIDSFISAALAAKVQLNNMRVIAAIVAASGDPVVWSECAGEDAFSTFFDAVQGAVTDIRYRSYMGLMREFEVVVPAWQLANMRTALMHRRAIDDPVKADSWIQAQFAKIGVTLHFVYGWQDAHVDTETPGLPGGETPITTLPSTVDFAVYPAGTWVKAVNPVIELDTIYDSTGLQNNSYTALFIEDGWSAIQLCPYSRVYTVAVDRCACGCAAATS